MVTCAENITWSRTVYVWSVCLKSAGSATFSPFIKSTVCFVCDIGPLLHFAHANCRAVPSQHCWMKPSCNVKAVQTVLLSLEFAFMFDPSVVPAVFCTAGTTATWTQIRKLISYICYPSPRMPIKLIWRLNFHMSFMKLWDCLMFTNSSQCVSNWIRGTRLIQFVWRKSQMMCHSLQLHPGVLLNQLTQRKPSMKKEFWIKLFHFSESEKCKAVFVLT